MIVIGQPIKEHHNSGELMREAKLNDAQVKQLADSELIEIVHIR